MARYWSPTTGGFYSTELHAELPADVVKITAKRHAELVAAQAEGAEIVADRKGKPVAKIPQATIELQLAAARRRVKREARRRILAAVSIEQQVNDNADLALAAIELATTGSTSIDLVPAIERRAKVDALRVASNEIELQLASLKADELAAFNPAEAAWPTIEEAR